MNEGPRPILDVLTLGPVDTNCYVVSVPDGPDPEGCFVVDCGMQPGPLVELVRRRGLLPRGLLLTHCHYDHIGGIEALFEEFGVLPSWVHPLEEDWNLDPMRNLSGMSGWPCIAPAPDRRFQDGDLLDLLGTSWRVLHLPGHSPGSVGLFEESTRSLIAGDTLFAGSIGRVDFPTSNPSHLRDSLARILELPDETTVHPGHGPATSVAVERAGNPFLLDPDLIR